MKFLSKNPSAQYRAEGLSLTQASRLSDTGSDSGKTLLIAALAFVAVGSLAYIGLQQITGPGEVKRVYSAAPPSGTAHQLMMALKVPHDREQEAARLALLNDETGPMEIKSLDRVEALVNPAAIRQRPASAQIVTVEPEPAPAVAPVVEALPEPEITDALQEVELVAAPQDAQSCISEVETVARNSTIFFGVGSAQLTADAISGLQTFGRLVAACPEATGHVTGHSDTTGNDLTNLNLSWKRADNVVTALGQLGIETDRFEPVGFGARSPLAQGDSSDEELNRRVEFVVLRRNE